MGQHDQSLQPYRIFVKKTTNQPPSGGILKIPFPTYGITTCTLERRTIPDRPHQINACKIPLGLLSLLILTPLQAANPLVDVDWLLANLINSNLTVLDLQPFPGQAI